MASLFSPNSAKDAPIFITQFKWSPVTPGKGHNNASDVYIIGATDGKFYICSKNGKLEKAVEAHDGALLSLNWNHEGNAICTGGEDGQLKIWSRNGMLRTVLIQSGYPIYSTAWSPNNDQILFTNGKNLSIKSVQAGTKPNQWKAHDGVILQVSWNQVNNTIISASEDRKYKVWDSYGRQLYSSAIHDHSITSIAWNPSGEIFAVGSYNTIRVCDKLGWSYTLSKPECGSVFDISWTPDGTQLACATGSGSVVFGHITNRRFECKNFWVTQITDRKIQIQDVSKGNEEVLDLKDRVVKISFRFGYLVVATSTQCHIYTDKNWSTPSIIDLSNNGRVTCIQQCSTCFAVVDNYSGIQIFSYDGKLISSPKYPGLRAEFITPQNISISSDLLAVKDRIDEKMVHLFDIKTASPIIEGGIKHTVEIIEIALSQYTSSVGRQLVIIDKNNDLNITIALKPIFKKIGTMVESIAWNDDSDILSALSDGKFMVWYYPNAAFVDEDILPLTKLLKEGRLNRRTHSNHNSSFGKHAQLVKFTQTQCLVRCADGALVSVCGISPLPAMLQEFSKKQQWEEAIKLCRHVNVNELWACLAAIAVYGQDLNTAEVAYAAIDEVQKVQFICQIKGIPSPEGRAAELALLRKQPREAESILLSASLTFRAIKMWIDLFNWDRALEIAVKYKTHIDTVLYFRAKYLQSLEKQESSKKFIHLSKEIELDWEKIKAKISMEVEEEKKNRKAVLR